MPNHPTDTFQLGKTAKLIAASASDQRKIINAHGTKFWWKTAENVGSGDTEIAVGSSFETEVPVWIVSETESTVVVEHIPATEYADLTVTDTLTVTGTTTHTGAVTNTGGVAASSGTLPGVFVGNWHPNTAESGTDTAPAEKKLFTGSLFLPCNKKIKGICFLVGSVGGTNKVVAGLYNSAGTLVAHSSETTEGATVGTAKEIQEVELTAEYSAVGRALYFIGITMNGNTARIRTIPSNTIGSNLLCKEITITEKNKLAAITAPTAVEQGKGPVAWVF